MQLYTHQPNQYSHLGTLLQINNLENTFVFLKCKLIAKKNTIETTKTQNVFDAINITLCTFILVSSLSLSKKKTQFQIYKTRFYERQINYLLTALQSFSNFQQF